MNNKEFITNFAELFEDTPLTDFSSETRFRDLEEWDSLHAMEIMAMVNEKYKVRITPDELRNSHTIAEVFEVVKAKMQNSNV